MKVVGKVFGKRPDIMEIGNELKDMQNFVGGYIEVPFVSQGLRERNIALVVKEEGMIKNLEPTLALVKGQEVLGCLVGQFFFCGIDEDDFTSLNNEQMNYILDNMVFNGAYVGSSKIDVLLV